MASIFEYFPSSILLNSLSINQLLESYNMKSQQLCERTSLALWLWRTLTSRKFTLENWTVKWQRKITQKKKIPTPSCVLKVCDFVLYCIQNYQREYQVYSSEHWSSIWSSFYTFSKVFLFSFSYSCHCSFCDLFQWKLLPVMSIQLMSQVCAVAPPRFLISAKISPVSVQYGIYIIVSSLTCPHCCKNRNHQ